MPYLATLLGTEVVTPMVLIGGGRAQGVACCILGGPFTRDWYVFVHLVAVTVIPQMHASHSLRVVVGRSELHYDCYCKRLPRNTPCIRLVYN